MSERWDRTVKKAFGEDAAIIFPRFFESKKNQVTLLEISSGGELFFVVSKFFVWGRSEIEWDILNRAHDAGLSVPRPIKRVDNVIFMEYVKGKSARSILRKTGDLDAYKIGEWMGKFHRAFIVDAGNTLLKGDVMLPNFIFTDRGGLYGIDFEEVKTGRPVGELGDLLSSFLSVCKPGFDVGLQRCRDFIRGYVKENPVDIDDAGLIRCAVEHLERRKLYVPSLAEHLEGVIGLIKGERFEFTP